MTSVVTGSLEFGDVIGGIPISFWIQAVLVDHYVSLKTLGSFCVSSWIICIMSVWDMWPFPSLLRVGWAGFSILCIPRWSWYRWVVLRCSVVGIFVFFLSPGRLCCRPVEEREQRIVELTVSGTCTGYEHLGVDTNLQIYDRALIMLNLESTLRVESSIYGDPEMFIVLDHF